MKLIEAVWEKRNLGVSCLEIVIEKKDEVGDVLSAISERSEEYMVAKVPSGRTDILLGLQTKGFQFIETLFEIKAKVSEEPQLPEMCKRFIKDISYHFADKNEIEEVIDHISEGTVFSTDRIALDPHFSPKIAGIRYGNWIRDVMAQEGSKLIITELYGKRVGFVVMQKKNGYYDPFLSGLFAEYLDSGYGFVNPYCSQKCLYELGAKKSVSHISSNNYKILNIDLMFGSQISAITYVLVKHSED